MYSNPVPNVNPSADGHSKKARFPSLIDAILTKPSAFTFSTLRLGRATKTKADGTWDGVSFRRCIIQSTIQTIQLNLLDYQPATSQPVS